MVIFLSLGQFLHFLLNHLIYWEGDSAELNTDDILERFGDFSVKYHQDMYLVFVAVSTYDTK